MINKILLILLSIYLSSCATKVAQQTATLTSLPEPSETSLPTDTPVPSETPNALATLLAQSTPATVWRSIPIMPGAVEGTGDDNRYYFTINSSIDEIKAYYEHELSEIGAQMLPLEDSTNSFMMAGFVGDDSITISIDRVGDGFLVSFLTVEGLRAAASQVPLQTAIPTETNIVFVDFHNLQGIPVSEWNGIPIMPQATAAQESRDEFSVKYYFSVNATPEEVQSFYNEEKLKSLGWILTRPDEGKFDILIMNGYRKGSMFLTIGINILEENSIVVSLGIITN